MTAQPTGPAHGPDTGSYEVIHLGGHAAVVVRVGRYEINGDVVPVWHIARGKTSG